MAVILKCPLCREKFKYDVSQGWPDFCPRCGEDINNNRDDDDIVCPNILSFKTKNNDKVARDIMDGSNVRAELAAQAAGTSVDEMSSLKITDLNDRNDAQIAAREIVNPVTQQMDLIRANGGQVGFGAANGSEWAAAAHTGAVPNAGTKAHAKLQNMLQPIGQAPLPREIADNPGYRSRR